MKSEIKRLYLQKQNPLRAGSFKLYLKILRQLLEEHREHEFLKPLADSLRARDFGLLYSRADSLSKQQYVDATCHFVANQFALLIKKYPWTQAQTGLDPRAFAVKTFNAAEKRCGLLNRKFALLRIDPSRDKFKREGSIARNFVRSCIGTRPSYEDISRRADFGPGASMGVHGNATSYLAKQLARRWSVSPGALHFGFKALIHNHQLLEEFLPKSPCGKYFCLDLEKAFLAYLDRTEVLRNNKISFVPKTAKTFRSIAVEPLLNGFLQKGSDLKLRSLLLKIGIDISDQSKNQRMAHLGSLDDSDEGFVTIDLSSASDSISKGIVSYLIPTDWVDLLSRIRSDCYSLDGVVKTYEKYCSMGNGFCFPLETLIFAAACFASGCGTPSKDFSVYGDDIIVRKKHAPQLLDLLSHWGFKVNADKTFLFGPFRESCGADYFGGEDVRPFTLDYALDSVENIFKFLNLSRRNERCDAFFNSVRGLLVDTLPPVLRLFRPFPGPADSGIDSIGSEFMSTPSCRFKNGKWEWFEIHHEPVVDFDSLSRAKDQPWLIGVALRGALSITSGSMKGLPSVTLRRKTKARIVRKGYVSTSNWLPPR